MKRIAKRTVLGRRGLQPLFGALHRFSLRGMNIGGGSDVEDSGERYALQRIARATAGRAVVLFDVGANVGTYALILHQLFGGRAEIHLFEPSKPTFDILRDRCSSFAHVNNLGLSDDQAEMMLYVDAERSGLSSVYARELDHLNVHMRPSETISLDTLDHYCREHGIGHIDLLKLDVEGHELAVLRGAKALLDSAAIDVLQFEFGGCNIDSRTFFRDFYTLLAPQFRLYRVLANGLWPIEGYSELLETFTTTNYLAVRRGIDGGL